jgi:hypothetical protein
MFLLKQNNLDVIVTCGWLCANVPICLLGGHKSRHNRDAFVIGACWNGPSAREARDVCSGQSEDFQSNQSALG